MRHSSIILLVVSFLSLQIRSEACTSVIVSSSHTVSGKPLMYKNRDTGKLDNKMGYFTGVKYSYIGLMNSSSKGGSIWSGTNSAGFCIMNTASYNLKDDDIPDSMMDQEGVLMRKALEVCATVNDFECFLDTLQRPMRVETNIGVIDAQGGAAYYEINNTRWVKFDVNDPAVAPDGYLVVTNFSRSGRPEDSKGVERFETASAIFSEYVKKCKGGLLDMDHDFFFDKLSRSYRHEKLGVDYRKNPGEIYRRGRTGIAVDQDFIPRISTSASVVFEGVRNGENPCYTVMWTILGYPSCGVAIPMLVGEADHIPYYMKDSEESDNSVMCDAALAIKKSYVFTDTVSNGSHYFHIDTVIKGTRNKPSLISCCKKAESSILSSFIGIFSEWEKGKMKDDEFWSLYDKESATYFDLYKSCFQAFM